LSGEQNQGRGSGLSPAPGKADTGAGESPEPLPVVPRLSARRARNTIVEIEGLIAPDETHGACSRIKAKFAD
jgi:hypothetical protein